MGSLDRSEFPTIPLEVYFLFKIHFELEFFQNGIRPGALLPWINKWRRITRRAVFAPAGVDFNIQYFISIKVQYYNITILQLKTTV
jgi:hypothetical protein